MNECQSSRSGSDWRKEDALTWGGLNFSERIVEKSVEAIVGFGNEPSQKRRRTHRKAEGLNVKLS